MSKSLICSFLGKKRALGKPMSKFPALQELDTITASHPPDCENSSPDTVHTVLYSVHTVHVLNHNMSSESYCDFAKIFAIFVMTEQQSMKDGVILEERNETLYCRQVVQNCFSTPIPKFHILVLQCCFLTWHRAPENLECFS